MSSIRDFKLFWRWNNPNHFFLPEAVLASMTPLSQNEAREAWLKVKMMLDNRDPKQCLFRNVRRYPADDTAYEFLATLEIERMKHVLVSWDEDTALHTTWAIFADNWEAFCYPSSDDVAIAPRDNTWVLIYDHFELFTFAS
jgi:hypothetical protein